MALAALHTTNAGAMPLRADASGRYVLGALLATAALLATMLLIGQDARSAALREHGAVETLSALFFFATALVLLPARLRVWPYTAVALACGLRELDMDKSMFTQGLLKSRQYFGDTVPMGERLVAIAILTALLTAGVLALKRGLRNAGIRIRNGDGVILCVIAGLILAAVAKSLDGVARKLATFGVEASDAATRHATLFEEVGEFGMALCFLCAAIAFMRAFTPTSSNGAMK